MAEKRKNSVPQELWDLVANTFKGIAELRESQKETDRQLKETDRQLKESKLETDRQLKETDRQLKESKLETDRQLKESKLETDRQLKESKLETDRQLKETDRQLKESKLETNRQLKESDRRLKKLDELFTGQWGKLIETLVEGDLIKLLKEKNISVERTFQNTKGKFEFDILAVNGEEVVVVEVKTTLRLKDVDYFIKKLKEFKSTFPEYKNKKIYGAVAYLKTIEGSDRNSEKKGLFVIRATGNSATITNTPHFKPKEF